MEHETDEDRSLRWMSEVQKRIFPVTLMPVKSLGRKNWGNTLFDQFPENIVSLEVWHMNRAVVLQQDIFFDGLNKSDPGFALNKNFPLITMKRQVASGRLKAQLEHDQISFLKDLKIYDSQSPHSGQIGICSFGIRSTESNQYPVGLAGSLSEAMSIRTENVVSTLKHINPVLEALRDKFNENILASVLWELINTDQWVFDRIQSAHIIDPTDGDFERLEKKLQIMVLELTIQSRFDWSYAIPKETHNFSDKDWLNLIPTLTARGVFGRDVSDVERFWEFMREQGLMPKWRWLLIFQSWIPIESEGDDISELEKKINRIRHNKLLFGVFELFKQMLTTPVNFVKENPLFLDSSSIRSMLGTLPIHVFDQDEPIPCVTSLQTAEAIPTVIISQGNKIMVTVVVEWCRPENTDIVRVWHIPKLSIERKNSQLLDKKDRHFFGCVKIQWELMTSFVKEKLGYPTPMSPVCDRSLVDLATDIGASEVFNEDNLHRTVKVIDDFYLISNDLTIQKIERLRESRRYLRRNMRKWQIKSTLGKEAARERFFSRIDRLWKGMLLRLPNGKQVPIPTGADIIAAGQLVNEKNKQLWGSSPAKVKEFWAKATSDKKQLDKETSVITAAEKKKSRRLYFWDTTAAVHREDLIDEKNVALCGVNQCIYKQSGTGQGFCPDHEALYANLAGDERYLAEFLNCRIMGRMLWVRTPPTEKQGLNELIRNWYPAKNRRSQLDVECDILRSFIIIWARQFHINVPNRFQESNKTTTETLLLKAISRPLGGWDSWNTLFESMKSRLDVLDGDLVSNMIRVAVDIPFYLAIRQGKVPLIEGEEPLFDANVARDMNRPLNVMMEETESQWFKTENDPSKLSFVPSICNGTALESMVYDKSQGDMIIIHILGGYRAFPKVDDGTHVLSGANLAASQRLFVLSGLSLTRNNITNEVSFEQIREHPNYPKLRDDFDQMEIEKVVEITLSVLISREFRPDRPFNKGKKFFQ